MIWIILNITGQIIGNAIWNVMLWNQMGTNGCLILWNRKHRETYFNSENWIELMHHMSTREKAETYFHLEIRLHAHVYERKTISQIVLNLMYVQLGIFFFLPLSIAKASSCCNFVVEQNSNWYNFEFSATH